MELKKKFKQKNNKTRQNKASTHLIIVLKRKRREKQESTIRWDKGLEVSRYDEYQAIDSRHTMNSKKDKNKKIICTRVKQLKFKVKENILKVARKQELLFQEDIVMRSSKCWTKTLANLEFHIYRIHPFRMNITYKHFQIHKKKIGHQESCTNGITKRCSSVRNKIILKKD